MKVALFPALILTAFSACVAPAAAGSARVKVATLDGEPVYHWRLFKSANADDIDRALTCEISGATS